MAKTSALMQQYARLGAQARLATLRAEVDAIEIAFPELAVRRGPGRRPSALALAARTENSQTVGRRDTTTRPRRQRKPMTAAQRKAVGERMKKYWAARRKAKSAAR